MNSVAILECLYGDLILAPGTRAVLELAPVSNSLHFQLIVNDQRCLFFHRPLPSGPITIPDQVEITMEYSHENIAIAYFRVWGEHFEEQFFLSSIPGLSYNDSGEDAEFPDINEIESDGFAFA